ncbi:hypothetical protein NPIL_668801 [Nephila pilipes]|uniref:Uncharacterized protein n=1 Tax=Nephila pilipes TaxID=299642 RepID=A0A8X6NVG7_NEPPI|nr:hypothetical protein NPIL_668801 [Nephila pilipes]
MDKHTSIHEAGGDISKVLFPTLSDKVRNDCTNQYTPPNMSYQCATKMSFLQLEPPTYLPYLPKRILEDDSESDEETLIESRCGNSGDHFRTADHNYSKYNIESSDKLLHSSVKPLKPQLQKNQTRHSASKNQSETVSESNDKNDKNTRKKNDFNLFQTPEYLPHLPTRILEDDTESDEET